MRSIEEKWILNQIQHETYDRWMKDISEARVNFRMQIERLSQDQRVMYDKYYGILDKLTDMSFLFKKCSLADGHEFLRKVFDVNLYYSRRTSNTHHARTF